MLPFLPGIWPPNSVPAATHPRLSTPALAVPIPAPEDLAETEASWRRGLPKELAAFAEGGATFLSINRFERKKVGRAGARLAVGLAARAACLSASRGSPSCHNASVSALPIHIVYNTTSSPVQSIGLAIEALRELRSRGPAYATTRLVVAGGYDPRLAENVEHLAELRQLAERAGVADAVRFLPSFSDRQRALLLAACVGVLYTPQREHFGIVPLEAMAAGRPVVACNSGGPTESVADGVTGFLRPPEAAAWADAMAALLERGAAARMGAAARQHVQAKFSRTAFGEALNAQVVALAARPRDLPPGASRQQRRQAARAAGRI